MEPYAFQTEVAKLAAQSRDLLLQAPTGAGKTRAALEPAIDGFYADATRRSAQYPPRLVYAVPMRVLAKSFRTESEKQAREKRWEHEWHPTIQTGEQPGDTLFEGAVIFATVDQVLASFLNVPFGVPRKLDNINQGAFIGSYLVFDEVHLFPRNEMLLSVLAMLKMLKGVSRFLLMSATFSATFMQTMGKLLDADLIADPPGTALDDGLFHDIPSLKSRSRTFFAEDGPLNAEAIQRYRQDAQRTLCICNTVDRAQALYHSLSSDDQIECHLLHSRFLRSDRHQTEQFVLGQFEERKTGKPVVLIATQVIEVGVNISSDVLLTECATGASLIQRAGRCARREKEQGKVHVFQPFDEEGKVNYAPYSDEENGPICEKAWQALTSSQFQGRVMGFAEEQQLIEIAHGEDDGAFVSGLAQKIDRRIEEITACMRERSDGYRGRLIRQQDSVSLYVDANPNADQTLTERPHQRESFSVSKGQLFRLFETALDSEAPFILCVGHDIADSDPEAPPSRARVRWDPLREPGEVYASGNWRFVAHPQAITYDPKLGLRFIPDPNTPHDCLGEEKKVTWERIAYHAERYHEHIHGLHLAYSTPITIRMRSYRPLQEEIAYPLARLCTAAGRDYGTAERLVRLTLALHDIGKLNEPWQRWSSGWQEYRNENGYSSQLVPEDAPFAHTDFDSGDPAERELQKLYNRQRTRGTHAVESGEATLALIEAQAEGDPFWMAVVLAAIMHHHTPDADQCGNFTLVAGGQAAIARSLEACGFGAESEAWARQIKGHFAASSVDLSELSKGVAPFRTDFRKSQFYALFVRALRLSDQRSGAYVQQHYGRS